MKWQMNFSITYPMDGFQLGVVSKLDTLMWGKISNENESMYIEMPVPLPSIFPSMNVTSWKNSHLNVRNMTQFVFVNLTHVYITSAIILLGILSRYKGFL